MLNTDRGFTMFNSKTRNTLIASLLGLAVFSLSPAAFADSGPFLGGSDPAYGVGLRFTLGSIEIRGEYEVFDIEDADDVYMASAGLVWRF